MPIVSPCNTCNNNSAAVAKQRIIFPIYFNRNRKLRIAGDRKPLWKLRCFESFTESTITIWVLNIVNMNKITSRAIAWIIIRQTRRLLSIPGNFSSIHVLFFLFARSIRIGKNYEIANNIEVNCLIIYLFTKLTPKKL